MSEKISIVLTARNEEEYISACISSIQKQTFQNWELIAVDDHSTDETLNILLQLSQQDNRITVLSNTGEGIIPALTLAYSRATGQFITRMDADDLMPEDKLETLYQLLDKKSGYIATGKVRYFSEGILSEGYQKYEDWLNQLCSTHTHWDWVFRECVIASPNWLCHRDCIDQIGGFEGLVYPEDYDLVLKWFRAGIPIISTNKITHLWREHSERTSRNSLIYEQKSFFQLKLQHFAAHFTTSNVLIAGRGSKAKLTQSILTTDNLLVKRIETEKELLNLPFNHSNTILLLAFLPDSTTEYLFKKLCDNNYILGQSLFVL